MLQVFWGLLACQILNGKGRDVVEHTSLKKMRELLVQKFGALEASGFASQEHMQSVSWMLHWLLIYSFTAKDLTNTGLFATILADHSTYGTNFMSLIQMRSEALSRYLIVSFLLARGQPSEKYQVNKNGLQDLALPLALENLNSAESDPYSSFLKAVYEDYDLDTAIQQVEKMAEHASEDFLLKNYVFDIKKQAYLLIFQTKCQLFRTVDISEMTKALGTGTPTDTATEEIQRHFNEDGFDLQVDEKANTMSCIVLKQSDAEQVI